MCSILVSQNEDHDSKTGFCRLFQLIGSDQILRNLPIDWAVTEGGMEDLTTGVQKASYED